MVGDQHSGDGKRCDGKWQLGYDRHAAERCGLYSPPRFFGTHRQVLGDWPRQPQDRATLALIVSDTSDTADGRTERDGHYPDVLCHAADGAHEADHAEEYAGHGQYDTGYIAEIQSQQASVCFFGAQAVPAEERQYTHAHLEIAVQ